MDIKEGSAPNATPTSITFFSIYILIFFLIWSLRATVFYQTDSSIESQTLRVIYSNFIKFILWIVPAFFYLKRFDRRKPLEYLKLTSRADKRGLTHAALLTLLFFTGMIVFEYYASGRTLKSLFNSPASEWFNVLLFVAFSPFLEEVLFRGFILNKFSESLRFWNANALASILFVLIHWPYWLWSQGFQASIISTSVSIFILSLFLGYLMKITNSLWPSVVAHIINNVLSNFLRP